MKACMTPREFVLWDEVNLGKATPCFDCMPEFHAAMSAKGLCDGEPQVTGRPQMGAATPAVQRLRAQWREASRRQRARRKTAA